MALRDLVASKKPREPATTGETTDPFRALHRQIDRVFDDFWRGFGTGGPPLNGVFGAAWQWPSVEVTETEKEVEVIAELAGLDEKDVDLQLSDGELIIRGEKRSENADKEHLWSERFYGRFERRVPLNEVDADKAVASFKNGVLKVTLPKLPPEKSSVKRIAINSKAE